MRAILYARVSTAEQAAGHSLGFQLRRCEQYCMARGWTVVGTECDQAESGSVPMGARPAGLVALASLASGEAEVLVAWKLDRLTRSVAGWVTITEAASAGEWALCVVDDAFDMATPAGRAMAGMLAVFAQLERDLISDRTKAGLAQARESGVRLGRLPHRSETLAAVAHMMRTGLGYKRICRQLNDRGLARPDGSEEWTVGATRGAMRAARGLPPAVG